MESGQHLIEDAPLTDLGELPNVASSGDEASSATAGTLRPGQLKRRVILADAAALALGFLVAFAVQRQVRPVPRSIVIEHVVCIVAALPAFALGAAANRLYHARANERPAEEAGHILRAVLSGFAALVAVSVAFKIEHLSRLWLALSAISVLAAVLIERRIVRAKFADLRRDGRLRRRILIVGTDAHAIGLMHAYRRNPALGYEVAGFVGEDELGLREGVRVVGGIDQLPTLLAELECVGVSVSIPGVSDGVVNDLTRRLTDQGYHVTLSSSLRDISIDRLRAQQVDGQTLLYVEPIVREGWRALAKRVFDVAVACLILAFTLPVLAAAALAVKLNSHGPALFRQTRVGRNGREFEILKLRTMVVDAEAQLDSLRSMNEADGPIFKIKADPRITTVGRFLRKLSIDELPQLWCVLRGTMSMVGPRPMLPAESLELDPPVLAERVRVPPGLTGLWQVSGRSDSSFADYCRLDQFYVDNWTLGHDLRICMRTVGVVLTGRGAS